MKRATFYICKHCGNIILKVVDSGVRVVCCGEKMEELIPNSTDAAREKHVPVVTVTGSTVHVAVGSVPHPMIEEHYIEWIYLVTEKGAFGWCLNPGDEPAATFTLAAGDTPLIAFAYCNLHGLWKADI